MYLDLPKNWKRSVKGDTFPRQEEREPENTNKEGNPNETLVNDEGGRKHDKNQILPGKQKEPPSRKASYIHGPMQQNGGQLDIQGEMQDAQL